MFVRNIKSHLDGVLYGTHIVYPDELADAGVGLHLTLEVHVHTLSDVGGVDVAAETHAHRG